MFWPEVEMTSLSNMAAPIANESYGTILMIPSRLKL